MKGGYKIIDFKHVPLSDADHPALVPDLRAVLDENYGKAVLLTNVVLGEDSMDDCFSTVILKSNGRIKLNSYDGYITVDLDSYAHYTEGGSGDPTTDIEEIKEDIQDIQTDINELNTKVSKTEDLISIVENGNTCTHTGGILAGQYVNWKGNLYTADSNISVGTTFASSGGSKNLTAVADGGLNNIKNYLVARKTVNCAKTSGVNGRFECDSSEISGTILGCSATGGWLTTNPGYYMNKIRVGIFDITANGSLQFNNASSFDVTFYYIPSVQL